MVVGGLRRSPSNSIGRTPPRLRAVVASMCLVLITAGCGAVEGNAADDTPGMNPPESGAGEPVDVASEPDGPSEQPGAVTRPVSATGLGFSPGAGLRDQDDARLAGDLDAMVEIGATWIRVDVDWSVVETEPDRYDWSQTDRIIDAAAARGLQVVAMVAYSPPWARPAGFGDKAPPNQIEDFVDFVSDAVARYRPRGVRTWQVWNEPNSALFWATGPDPERYGSLLSAAAEAIRLGDSSATILSAGLAPADDRPEDGWLSPETFLAGLIDNGSLAEIDAVAIHPYSFPARPLDPASAPWNTFLRLPDLHQLLLDADVGPREIWITEYGAPTGTHERAVGEADQAVMLTDALDAASVWPWLGPIFLYTLRDFSERPAELESNYGILRPDGSPKQAWIELVERRG